MLLIKLTWKLSVGYQLYEVDSQVNGETSTSAQGETVWVEGLVPGIDFCNHGMWYDHHNPVIHGIVYLSSLYSVVII